MALAAGTLGILGLSAWWNLGVQRRHLTEMVHTSADRIADFMLRSTRDAMMRNDPDAVRRIVGALGAQPGVEQIRLVDKKGLVHVATRSGQEGTTLDITAEQCTVCHGSGRTIERPERGQRLRVTETPEGRRLLDVVVPVPNEPDCSTAACHAHEGGPSVLGILDVSLSLDRVDEDVAASQHQMTLGISATALAMLLLTVVLVWRLVVRPVRTLERAMGDVAAGDLGARAPVLAADEIGALTASWNGLVADLQRARAELEEWNRTLEVRVEETTRELEKTHRHMVLVEKMASLGQLAAVVAHEINNPLAGIATYGRLLRKRLGREAAAAGRTLDPETDQALDLVEKEALRCGDVVRNLLLFSRAPTARFAEEDLHPFLERCALLLRHKADLQGVTITLDVTPDLPRVICDAAQVQQAILALCTNGIEAMPAGGPLRLTARKDPDGDGVLLEVADEGTGISAKDLPHIYEPFFTTKEEGKGVGLGLAVVYGIVSRHNGTIDVQTAPGQGTIFRLRLPRRPPAAAAPTPPPTPPPSPTPSAPGAAP